MAKGIVLEQLKALVEEYLKLVEHPMENSTEWAYAVLEPALLADEKVTLNFIKQMDKAEFEAIAYCFEEIVSKFRSKQIVEAIECVYHTYYGDDRQTEIYTDYIVGLRACIE